MNILIDAHVFDGEFQGSRTYIKELYSKAIIQFPQIDFYFAATNVENLRKNFPDRKNLHFLRLKTKNKYFRLFFEFPLLIRSHKIDYAHFQYICPLIKNTKWIVSIHDILFIDNKKYFPIKYSLIRRLLFYISAKRADILTTLSQYSKYSISRNFKIPLNNIVLAPCGVGDMYLNAHNKINAIKYVKEKYNLDKYIIYVSRIEPRKNHHCLLEAFLELSLDDIGYKLVFVGKESLKNTLYDKIVNGDAKKRVQTSLVRFVNLPEEELIQLLLAAKIAVYPSYAEGFGIPPLESAVMRVPTICSNLTSMEEFKFFGDNHIEPTLENIKTRITAILNGADKSNYTAIRSEIISRYDWEKSASILMDTLNFFNKNVSIK
jgi:glycosyltransferase involved in cell wall biosynthesis